MLLLNPEGNYIERSIDTRLGAISNRAMAALSAAASLGHGFKKI